MIFPKCDAHKMVKDPRILNAIKEASKNHFILLPFQVGSIHRKIAKQIGPTDLDTAYHNVASTPNSQGLGHFVVGNDKYKQN